MDAGRIAVSGASLYYEVRGTGPVLLVSQSGEGDAGRSVDMVERLAADYTVITYDRRGLSRSAPAPGRGVTIAEHADDVHRLLAAFTDEPVAMLGCSLGAVIGLHLAVRHPEQIGTLIAHEPVAPWLLPGGERARHVAELVDIQRLYQREGLGPALKMVAEVLGIAPDNPDAEPGLTPQPMTSQRVANFGFFIEHDFTAVVDDSLDVGELAGTSTRIVPATGLATPRSVFDYRCAEELGALIGTEVREFPGGHNGNTSHPRAYALQVDRILRSA